METLPEFIAGKLHEPREHAFAERLGAEAWTYTSSTRMLERARAIARALHAAGALPGDRVALISNNRVDWLAADFGILLAGCVSVPVFATIALDQLAYIFSDSAAKLAFVETPADAERVRAACPNAPRLIQFDGSGPDSLAAFEGSATAMPAEPATAVAEPAPHTAAAPDDLAVLIYTSGTTGQPKGVMLSHRNLISNTLAASELLPDDIKRGGQVVLSVLPFAHIFEHTDVLSYMHSRSEVYITQPDFLLADLKSARPRVMALVPRIFERVLAGIVGKAKAEGGLKAKLVPWALNAGREYMAAVTAGQTPGAMTALQFAVAQRLVFSKIKDVVGLDRLEFFASGSAPLHRDIALTFAAMGIPICEGYGLTETSPVVTANPTGAIRYGSVGKPISGVEVKLAEDGEILVKGPNVMQGYYNLPDERPFTEDGWFRTGDIGELDADGYLFITDRKKELIKTSAGKYVAPGRVEAALKRSVHIGQCFVIGDGRAFPAALICPNWETVRLELDLPAGVPNEELAARPEVREFFAREAADKTSDLASFEAVRRVALLTRDLTVEDGELSPTLKIKRRVVEQKFAMLIESAYARSASTA